MTLAFCRRFEPGVESDGASTTGGSGRPNTFVAITWLGLTVMALLPLVVARLPPLTDYPQWLMQGAIFERLLTGGAGDSVRLSYRISLVPVPNAVAPLAIGVLRLWLAPDDAGRVFLTTSVLAFSYGFAFLVRSVQGRRTALEFLGFPWAYGYFLYWGFLSYVLALGLAFLAIGLLHRLVWRPPLHRPLPWYLVLTLLNIVTYLCHLFGWAMFTLAVLVYALACLRDGRRRTAVALVLTALPACALLVVYAATDAGHGTTEIYQSPIDKGLAVVSPLFLFLRTDPFPSPFPMLATNAVCGLLLLGVVGWQLRRRPVDKLQRPLLLVTGILLLGALLIPFNWFGGLVAPDNRLVLPALLLGIAGLPAVAWRPLPGVATAVVIVLILGLHSAEYARAGALLSALQAATNAAVPADGPVLVLTVHDPPVRAACRPGRVPSLGAPVLDWFALYHRMATGQLSSSLFDSSIIVPREGAPLDVVVQQVLPADLPAVLSSPAALATRFATVEAFGCRPALQSVQTLLAPTFQVHAMGDVYAVLVRRSPSP